MIKMTVTGLSELRDRFAKFPNEFRKAMNLTMDTVLLILWENVPAYPPEPAESSYTRTGTLGRTLGISETGSRGSSKPDIYEKKITAGYYEASFGTNLGYAPYVIGDNEQAWMHAGRWWTMKTIAEAAQGKIIEIFSKLAQKMADFLDRKGA